jgi:ribosome-binding protein aMBF1 (putative translation factor)
MQESVQEKMKEIGGVIKEERRKRGLSIELLMASIYSKNKSNSLSSSSIHRIENGKNIVVDNLITVCELLNLEIKLVPKGKKKSI